MERIDTPSRKQFILSTLWTCLISCGLTLVILTVVYALRGIWPFGTDNVAYVDTAQFYLPDYYGIWDALHGAEWKINWYSGLAEGGNAGWSDFLSPANWVFLLVSRDHVLEALSLYLAVHLLIIALAASLVLCLRFPRLHRSWKVLLTLAYTFSGFVLQYYSNFFWLSIVALFPIILYGLEFLLRTGKYVPYTIVYTYFLYNFSVYYAYMVTIYILIFSLGYCLFLLNKQQRGDRIFRLGLSTAAAYGLTASNWLNSTASITGSARFQTNMDSGLITGFTTWNITNTRHTTLMLFGMAFTIALMLRALLRQRRLSGDEQKTQGNAIRFFAFLLGMLAIPMVFTNIDTAWHFGQYNFFPMRYGYMLVATLLSAAALCLEEEAALPEICSAERKHGWLPAAVGTIFAVALAFLFPRLWSILQEYGACFLTALGTSGYWRYFAILVGCGLLFLGLYLSLFCLRNRKTGAILMTVVLLFQLGANAYSLLAPSDDHVYTNEYDPAYVEASDSLYHYLSQQDISPLARFKNVDNSLNAGYPAIAGASSISSVSSSNSNLRLGVFQDLGYTINYFRILDAGGTVFSDMLFGVQNILSAEEMDSSLYTDTGVSADSIRIGTANYPGYIGLTYTTGSLDDYLDILTLDGRLNTLYQAFTDTDETLAYLPNVSLSADGAGMKTYALTCELEENSFLYIAADGLLMNITAGGRTITVPSYQNTKNTVYPAAFHSNLLYIGSFEAGTAAIHFMSASELTEDSLTVIALKKHLLDSFYTDASYDENTVITTSDNSIAITLSASKPDQNLFLPLSYRYWVCTVNGEPVSITPAMGVLTSIPLQQGENEIHLSLDYKIPFFTASTVYVLVYLAAMVILWLLFLRPGSKLHIRQVPPALHTASAVLFYVVCTVVIAFLYIVPTIFLITQGTIVRF